MEPLYIKGTHDTPEIVLDQEKGVFCISGKSYPDDPFSVYQPVFDWIEDYAKNPNPSTMLELKLAYVNTASSKQVSDILVMFKNMSDKTNLSVKWFFDRMDEDMEFEGEALQQSLKMDIELIGT